MLAKLTAYRTQPSINKRQLRGFLFVLIQLISGHLKSTEVTYQK